MWNAPHASATRPSSTSGAFASTWRAISAPYSLARLGTAAMSGSSYWPMSAVYVQGTAPFSRIHATATEVSRPPEKAMPTRSPTGRLERTFDMRSSLLAALPVRRRRPIDSRHRSCGSPRRRRRIQWTGRAASRPGRRCSTHRTETWMKKHKVIGAASVAVLAIGLMGAAIAPAAAATGPESTYLVLAPQGKSTAKAADRVAAAGGTVVASYDQIGVLVAKS